LAFPHLVVIQEGPHTLSVLMSMVKMQTIEILKLFWHSRNVSFKVVRNTILAAKTAESLFHFLELHPGFHWWGYCTPQTH